jgi:hypothetical protein
LRSKLFLFIILIYNCRPDNVPSSAKYNGVKNEYELLETYEGKKVKNVWYHDGDSRIETVYEETKEVSLYFHLEELRRKVIVEKISSFETKIQEYNMHNILLKEELQERDSVDTTYYNWDGSFRERIVYKNGKNQKLPPKEKPKNIPETSQFNYTFRAWENGVLINNKKNGVWKLWLPTGEEYGFITYQNDIFHGRMFLKKDGIIYADIIMKEGKVFASPYLEKKAIEFHKNKTNELEERDFPIKEISEFTGLTEKQILEYRKNNRKK